YLNRGESMFSNDAIPFFSSISLTETDADITVTTDNGDIIIDNADGCNVAVYRADGLTLYAGPGQQHQRIAAGAGAYIVVAGQQTVKLIVR
ncbi:MAG: hypothetical protein K2O10_06455, partial [Muribaculaceae bacterium]|nr:hypothetical protein [Muribaculaceae bacterium]